MKRLLRALGFFRSEAARISFAFALMVLSTSAGLLKPWPLALIVDSILGGRPLPDWLGGMAAWETPLRLGVFSAAILGLHVTQGAISAWHNYLSIRIGLIGLARVRNEVFQWLLRLSLRFHHGANQGDVIYRASWDTYAFQTLMQQGIFTSVQAGLSLTLMLVVMWQMNERLTLWSSATVPLLLLTMKSFGEQMRRRSLAAHQADSKVTSLIQQTIAALPVIQSYTREPEEGERFSKQAAEALDRRVAQHGWEVLYLFAIAAVFGLGTAGATWFGAKEVLNDRLTTGELLIFVAYLAQLYDPLNQLSRVGTTVTDASAGIQRVFELLDTPEDVRERPDARPLIRAEGESVGPASRSVERGGAATPAASGRARSSAKVQASVAVRGAIELDGVSFSYPNGPPVLRDVTFSMAPRESLALIGPSGSGKTTLLQLLPRFYDPTAGSVRLDGVDLRDLRLRELRAEISLVFQEPILLSATVAENIAYGKPGASRDEIEAAASAAHADGFIRKLPSGYDTVLGEGGARLSVGERQRINLARAFLKDAPILVLDEPTSALDAESEAAVVAGLGELMRQRTALVVAHRLSTIRRVGRILVIEEGRITESGSHEELAKRDGYYARVAKLF